MDATQPNSRHALTVLTRLARRRQEASKWLKQALEQDLEGLAETALDIAVETGDPIGRVLAEVLAERFNS